MTSLWARWRLKSPASPLFTQLLVQVQIKENIKAPHHWPLCEEFSANEFGKVDIGEATSKQWYNFMSITICAYGLVYCCLFQCITMMTSSNGNIFPCHWPFVMRIRRSPVDSPHKGKWCGALMFSLICAWTNSLANNRYTGDLWRYRAHYDITVMTTGHSWYAQIVHALHQYCGCRCRGHVAPTTSILTTHMKYITHTNYITQETHRMATLNKVRERSAFEITASVVCNLIPNLP